MFLLQNRRNTCPVGRWELKIVKGTILVVDDDDAIRGLIKAVLEDSGFTVIEARDGEDAVTVTRNQSPHLILLDVMIPRIDGYTICRELKSSSLTRHIPIIFVTVKDQAQDRIEGFKIGADDYITKPFSPLELVARVEAVLNRAFHLLDSLTGLPGKGVLEEEILKGLAGKRPFSILGFRFEKGEKLVEQCGFSKASEEFVLLANVLIKSLSRDGDKQDFVSLRDRFTDVILTFVEKPEEIFDEVVNIWGKLLPTEEKRLGAAGLLQLNCVHLRVENFNTTLEIIFKMIQDFFEVGAESGKYFYAGKIE